MTAEQSCELEAGAQDGGAGDDAAAASRVMTIEGGVGGGKQRLLES